MTHEMLGKQSLLDTQSMQFVVVIALSQFDYAQSGKGTVTFGI